MPDLIVIICVAFDHRSDPTRLREFKKCIFACSAIEQALEVSGTFDLILHARVATFADYTKKMDGLATEMAEFAKRIEINFVGWKMDRHFSEAPMWVPCHDGRRRIDANTIDKIVAEGDYMRLHIGERNCLVHETIRSLLAQLDASLFIQLHRSIVVRIGFIDRMLHQGQRWVARLRDGSEQRVARGRVAEIIDMMSHSAISEVDPANRSPVGDNSKLVNELLMPTSP